MSSVCLGFGIVFLLLREVSAILGRLAKRKPYRDVILRQRIYPAGYSVVTPRGGPARGDLERRVEHLRGLFGSMKVISDERQIRFVAYRMPSDCPL